MDDHIPDPDNPSQPRQVDITVRRDGLLTLVDAAFTRPSKDVTWIEELIGHRASLRADLAMGVSASGFTEGALNKAREFGIVLRHLAGLTEAEIAQWGKAVSLSIGFYEYRDLELSLLFARGRVPHLDHQRIASLSGYAVVVQRFCQKAR
jgi:hypothetical protein